LILAYNSQPHRSTGIAPVELVLRNLPPGTPLKIQGTLNDGSPLARKHEFMAKLRQQIPAVVEAMQKTQQRYRRNFAANMDTRNQSIRVDDYVYTTNYPQKRKLRILTVGPFVVLGADDSTYVVDVNGEERRVNSDQGPSAPDETPHSLLDGHDKPERAPPVPEEYIIDRQLGFRRTNGIYRAKVRWFDYSPKEDSWEPF